MRVIWPTGVWGREEVPASLFAPVPGRDDGSTALGLGNWNTLQGFWRALLSVAGGVGQAFSPLAVWVAFWRRPFSALFLRPFGLPLLVALGRVKENSKVPPTTRDCGLSRGGLSDSLF